MAPDLLAGVEIPGLQLTDVVPAWRDIECRGRADIALPRRVSCRLAGDRRAQVLIGGDIEKTRLWTVGHRRPVLASPQRWAKIGFLSGSWLSNGIDIGPPGLRIEACENVLFYKRLAVDKVDLVCSALEHPEIAVAGDVDETLHGPAIMLIVDKDWG